MNQRQKKKSSQSRKRHFDAVKGKESGHPSGGQKQKSKEQAKPQPAPTSQPQSSKIQARGVAPVATGSVDSNAPHLDQRKTFSKRKVVSNWEKYDEERLGDDSGSLQESEEALQDRLLQLFNLPITHTMPSLADITDDQISSTSAAQELDDDGSSFLTLDCRALAEALSTLPLYQRLDIDSELFPEEERKGTGEFASKINLDSIPSRVDRHTDVILPRDGRESGALDLTASLKKFSEKQDANCRIESDFSSVGGERQAPATPAASTEDSKHAVSTNFEEEEERELNKLLSRTSEMKSLGENAEPTRVSSSLKNKGETQSSSSATTEIDSLTPATVDDETSELDDMLDELLA